MFILQAKFHYDNIVCFLIQREGFNKPNANGIGMQMVQLPENYGILEMNNDGSITLPQVNLQSYSQWNKNLNNTTTIQQKELLSKSCWYKVADLSCDKSQILDMKWTQPLMLGSLPSVAIIIKGIGLFELVDHCFASKFQDNGKIEDFSQSASNFYQLYHNYRFWTTNDGSLRVLVVCYHQNFYFFLFFFNFFFKVTPHLLPGADQVQWSHFVDAQDSDFWAKKILGNKFGYFIHDLRKGKKKKNK